MLVTQQVDVAGTRDASPGCDLRQRRDSYPARVNVADAIHAERAPFRLESLVPRSIRLDRTTSRLRRFGSCRLVEQRQLIVIVR